VTRSKLYRALLAAACLLGAVPLLAQTRVSAASPPGPAFPFGRYTITPEPGGNQNGAGLIIEISAATAKVFNGEQLLESHGVTVTGDTWQIFEFEGDCLEPGNYHWRSAGDVLTFELIDDPCAQRAQSVSTVRLVRSPAVPAIPAAPVTAAPFPYGSYTAPPPADAPAGSPQMRIELNDSAVQVYSAGQLTKSYGMRVSGDVWVVWDRVGGCADPQLILGTYNWTYAGGALTFEPLEDGCPGRSEKIAKLRLVRRQ
jgi:hypothetical protein